MPWWCVSSISSISVGPVESPKLTYELQTNVVHGEGTSESRVGPYRFCSGGTLYKPSWGYRFGYRFRVGPYRFCSNANPTTLSILLWSYLILSDTHIVKNEGLWNWRGSWLCFSNKWFRHLHVPKNLFKNRTSLLNNLQNKGNPVWLSHIGRPQQTTTPGLPSIIHPTRFFGTCDVRAKKGSHERASRWWPTSRYPKGPAIVELTTRRNWPHKMDGLDGLS